MASHLGGTRDPMVVAWPNRIKPDAQIRSQFTHVIDVGPTVLELAGIPEPKVVDGIVQEPMDGTSFVYTLEDAKAAERHTVQYFEIHGARAIYKDGWWACTRLDKLPWDLSPATMKRFAGQRVRPGKGFWELYNLNDDFSQAKNLAAENPEKLKELVERSGRRPSATGCCRSSPVSPSSSGFCRRCRRSRATRSRTACRTSTTGIPRIQGRSYAIEAELNVPGGRRRGRDRCQRRLHGRVRAVGR